MIESERIGSMLTIRFDHYTIAIDVQNAIESLSISDDRDREELKDILGKMSQMVSSELTHRKRTSISLDFNPINEFVVEAISEYNKQFVVFCIKHKERILIDYENPNNCKFVEPDNNGSIELRSMSGLAFTSRYSEKKAEIEEDEKTTTPIKGDEPSFIKKEVFVIMNDRILMYHLPFMGKVFEYKLNDDADSIEILRCIDDARIDGAILIQTYDGLSIDGKPLPVKPAFECELVAKLDHSGRDSICQAVIKGSDKKIYIDTYGEMVSFSDESSGFYLKLKDIVTGQIKDYRIKTGLDHKNFIYQTAN